MRMTMYLCACVFVFLCLRVYVSMWGQKNEGDDVWFGRPSASLVPNTKMKSIIQKGGILALAYFSVKKREWQVQLGLGG